ncbi:MAG TPA: hypothetical protein VMR19_01245 [Candidatus Saccharimonadales bacterium]|jgi:hypothetical protein|nr:hypothetical protein [Candidatus Saccharimonadales bacterium]
MSARMVNKAAIELLIFVLVIFVLILSAVNIENYTAPKKVLGVETKVNSEDVFWQDFLNKNPSYIPGLIETGKIDKAREIDPNYLIF